MEKLILASSSPRRKEILKLLGLPFTAVSVNIDEKISRERADIQTMDLSRKKMLAAIKSPLYNSCLWALGGDTLIEFNGKIIGKPDNRNEAFKIISSFSGKSHNVFTGLSLFSRQKDSILSDYSKTEVFFSKVSDKEINWYLESQEWIDAAGGYKIQKLGACFIEKIIGSYSNVMGLPINMFYGMLRAYNYPFF